MRLIDADRAMEIVRDQRIAHPSAYHLTNYATLILQEAPTVDAVEVVRCKDCLYSTERYGHMECIHGVSYRNTWNKPDFFCSYGERKEGADNG